MRDILLLQACPRTGQTKMVQDQTCDYNDNSMSM